MKSFLSGLFDKKPVWKIEFCQKNLDRHLTKDVFSDYEELMKSAQISYKEYECLSECKLCINSPYAKVNGTIVTGSDSKDLLAQLTQLMDK